MGWVVFVAQIPKTEVQTTYTGLLRKPWEKSSIGNRVTQYCNWKIRSFWGSSSSHWFSRVKSVFASLNAMLWTIPLKGSCKLKLSAWGKARQSFQLLQSQSLELPSQVGFRAWLQSNTFELLIAVALLLNVSRRMLDRGPTLKFCSRQV